MKAQTLCSAVVLHQDNLGVLFCFFSLYTLIVLIKWKQVLYDIPVGSNGRMNTGGVVVLLWLLFGVIIHYVAQLAEKLHIPHEMTDLRCLDVLKTVIDW